MKGMMAVLLLTVGGLLAADKVDLDQPLARLPIGGGRILEQVTFVRFGALDMFVRHRSGSMMLRYEALPDEIRAAAELKRPGGPRWFPGETASQSIVVEGQVFVQTRGAGPYKFGEAKVYAFAAEHLEAWKRAGLDQVVQLPKPLAVATTDGDGKFRLSLPKDTPYFVFCQTWRTFTDGSTERNEWRVRGEDFKNLREAFLTGKNTSERFTKVVIEETP